MAMARLFAVCDGRTPNDPKAITPTAINETTKLAPRTANKADMSDCIGWFLEL